ncbi:PEP-CTERM domain protein [Methylovorus sp. MM2]|uniref:lamin tail domain-containing protein n=1 Tax=Methylovorus sp. MM2 TaxID=1848038 RepID=UPI0007E10FDA|nr:lamin tail domain-containing protein [Methylovorus sp. MM2]OAM51917.1 PEP-CTERM domain protein [Methylovorus sp. MM2]
MKKSLAVLIGLLLSTAVAQAQAAIIISEVAPWSSGNSIVGADWFELTNTGNSSLSISGWKVDDSSNSFSAALALNGITNINAGQSVIFIEGTAATATTFVTTWFGSNVPAGFAIGYYSGSGIGLSASGDALNIYNASGVLQANVTFGNSDSTSPFQTFDNAAGLNNTAVSQLSVLGVNGAFKAANSASEIGSPGLIAAVPEPESYAMLLAGIALIGAIGRKRQSKLNQG